MNQAQENQLDASYQCTDCDEYVSMETLRCGCEGRLWCRRCGKPNKESLSFRQKADWACSCAELTEAREPLRTPLEVKRFVEDWLGFSHGNEHVGDAGDVIVEMEMRALRQFDVHVPYASGPTLTELTRAVMGRLLAGWNVVLHGGLRGTVGSNDTNPIEIQTSGRTPATVTMSREAFRTMRAKEAARLRRLGTIAPGYLWAGVSPFEGLIEVVDKGIVHFRGGATLSVAEVAADLRCSGIDTPDGCVRTGDLRRAPSTGYEYDVVGVLEDGLVRVGTEGIEGHLDLPAIQVAKWEILTTSTPANLPRRPPNASVSLCETQPSEPGLMQLWKVPDRPLPTCIERIVHTAAGGSVIFEADERNVLLAVGYERLLKEPAAGSGFASAAWWKELRAKAFAPDQSIKAHFKEATFDLSCPWQTVLSAPPVSVGETVTMTEEHYVNMHVAARRLAATPADRIDFEVLWFGTVDGSDLRLVRVTEAHYEKLERAGKGIGGTPQ